MVLFKPTVMLSSDLLVKDVVCPGMCFKDSMSYFKDGVKGVLDSRSMCPTSMTFPDKH